MHPLDNPVWHSLTGPHATVAEGDGLARRYDPEIALFAGIPDDATPDAWDALRALVGRSGVAALFRNDLAAPTGWELLTRMGCLQMVADAPGAAPTPRGEPLAAADVPDMLALVEKTKPGPFLARTIEFGGYVGVREHGELIAMTGERMRPRGYAEVSAVCTLPEHRGRGLAASLMASVMNGIRARGETPMLHVLTTNASAIGLYEKLGFRTRTAMDVTIVRAPT